MEIFIKAVQLILSLSILVILHEFGHFFFARLFNTRVEKFYLFFNPGFTLFKYKKGETEYGIGWLPLGGYVKISGMIDESMDKEALAKPAQPYEFRAKPAWQRLLIMTGGVLVNFITAMVIYWMILFTWGETYVPVQSAKFGLYFDEVAKDIGLKDGDVILKAGAKHIETTHDIVAAIVYDAQHEFTVIRNDEELIIPIPDDFSQTLLANEVKSFADFRFPTVVNKVMKKSAANEAGLLAGDSILSINGMPATFFNDFTRLLSAERGNEIKLSVYRDTAMVNLSTVVPESGKLGFYLTPITEYVEVKHHMYGFWEAFPKGIDKGLSTLSNYVKGIKLIFTKEGAKQVGGFGVMGSLFPPTWHWESFWSITAFISIILAFMNILPIPALDGGHVMFLAYEMITGRKPHDKVLEYAQIAGMALLFGLLIYANLNDIYKAFIK